MRAGQLDRRIVIEANTPAQGPTGEEAASWSVFATVSAGKRDLSGREFFAARQEGAEITTEWRIRWLPGLKAEMRIDARSEAERLADPTGGPRYDIDSFSEIGRREGYLIRATQVVA